MGREKKIEREEKGGTEIERKMAVKISEFTLNTYIMQHYYGRLHLESTFVNCQ
jgi:hypothetical protein